MKKEILNAENIKHSYISNDGNYVEAIEEINLKVFDNEFVAIVGPSGGGKSTILKILAGILEPTEGNILINGQSVNYKNNKIGYVSQSDTLLPWRNIIDNISIGLEIQGVAKEERYKISKDLMERNGLVGFENKYPKELSGGMAKRAIMLRALAVDPSIVFMDEPFGALDVFTKEILQDEIINIFENNNTTIVYVTHDIAEAIFLSDRIVVLTNRPAKIKNIYDIDSLRPRSREMLSTNPALLSLEEEIKNNIKNEFDKSWIQSEEEVYAESE